MEMRRTGIPFDAFTFSIGIRAYRRAKDWESVEALYEEAKSRRKIDSSVLASALSAFGQMQRRDLINDAWRESSAGMRTSGVCTSAMTAFASVGSLRQTLWVRRLMHRLHLEFSTASLNALLAACARTRRGRVALMAMRCYASVPRNENTFVQLIAALAQSRMFTEARSVLLSAKTVPRSAVAAFLAGVLDAEGSASAVASAEALAAASLRATPAGLAQIGDAALFEHHVVRADPSTAAADDRSVKQDEAGSSHEDAFVSLTAAECVDVVRRVLALADSARYTDLALDALRAQLAVLLQKQDSGSAAR